MLAILLTSVAIALPQPSPELAIDLNADDAAKQWFFSEGTAVLHDGELVCDGRQQMSRAFFLPSIWEDVSLRASFLVEPPAMRRFRKCAA